MSIDQIAMAKCFGGLQNRYRHPASSLHCDMTFSVFLPEELVAGADRRRFPVLYWLSGLTCSDENFVQKAGAQKLASELGLIVVAPDTSPRGEGVPDAEDGAYDLGLGAGFYVDATEPRWQKHYQMYRYIVDELPALINEHFPVDASRQSIFGHSMGGHGALTIALKNPDRYRSVSAFAPICAPSQSPWGRKALTAYLGEESPAWQQYDAVMLLRQCSQPVPMLIDQGTADEFLEQQLKPALLLEAAKEVAYPLSYNAREGYDHSYFFIASFIEFHLRFHHRALMANGSA